jgi:hypothetical protein
MIRRRKGISIVTLLAVGGAVSCATLGEIVALRRVDFAIDRLSGVRLAGIDVARIRSFDDLSVADAARLTRAVLEERLPLALTLHLDATNPADNANARLQRMDWTLLLRDRETVGGTFDESHAIPAGATTEIPLAIELDLTEFFEGGARELLDVALSLVEGTAPPDVALRATPILDTPRGPIRYPQPILIRWRGENR